ncbi:MAG: hypothetical protein ABFS09_00135 [Thermodesulfobacteriota bacterium]
MPFKKCTACGEKWLSQDEFLADQNVSLLGLQVCFDDLLEGLILFNHSCKTTFSVEVSKFENLYKGPRYLEPATGTEECPGYCLNERELKPCPTKCSCSFVREILQKIKYFPKKEE